MKTKILSFILGGFTFLCVGAGVATSTDILTVKPAVPKSVYHSEFGNYSELNRIISSKTKDGYLVKNWSVTFNDYGRVKQGFIVMEKY